MGRIRTVKPELAKHEALFDAERDTGLPLRFAWVMLFTVADREGRFPWQPRRLKADILPYDEVDFSRVLDAFEGCGLIQKYDVDGATYGCIPKWQKHQTVNQREAQSTIPPPPEKPRTCVHVQTPEEYVLERGLPNGVNLPKPYAAAIMFRDGDACVRCGATENLTIDHIFPQSSGGTHAPMNLRTLCKSCNSGRPVAGEGLAADLAMDGLTMEDRERICTHVHARGEGKGKEGKEKEGAPPVKAATNGKHHPRAKFTPPTLEEVTAYIHDRSSPIDPEAFIAYYAARGWKLGKDQMKDWKAAVITWEKRHKSEQTPRDVPAWR